MNKSHDSGWASDAPTPAQLKEFFAQIENRRITKEKLQMFLRGETSEVNIEEQKESWRIFYQKFFGTDIDFSSIRIPEKQPGFDRLIVVAQGLTLNQVYGKCAENFPCSRYIDDLDKAITQNDRNPIKGSYAIWVRDRIKADEELKNLSANDLKKKNILGITLLEHLLYGLKYWVETGKHLDIQNWTLCAGSRDSGGGVPSGRWYGDRLGVSWDDPDYRYVGLRARAAVS